MSPKYKRTLIIAAGAVTVLGGLTLAGAGLASAANPNPESNLADVLVSKFHLNKSEVQQVIDEHRRSRHDAMRQKLEQKAEQRLQQAVADGRISAAQKDQILAKLKELEAKHDALQDKSPEERRTAMKQEFQDLKTWAEANDIPLKYLMRSGHHHHKHHHNI